MAEMTQFRQEVSASERANISAIGEISAALEAALAEEREKSEQERQRVEAEIQKMIDTMVDNQQSRWISAVDNARQALFASQGRVQGFSQIVTKGLDNWQERESAFSKKLVSNKEEVKKSIVDASKALLPSFDANGRVLTSAVRPFKRVQDAFMHKPSSSLILR